MSIGRSTTLRNGDLLLRLLGDGYRRDEAVAAAGNVRDVAIARVPIAQGATERGNVNPEIAVLDERIGPDATHQLLIAQQLTGAFNERYQDLAGAAAQVNGRVAIEKQLSRWKESEGPEGYLAHRIDRTSCRFHQFQRSDRLGAQSNAEACDMSIATTSGDASYNLRSALLQFCDKWSPGYLMGPRRRRSDQQQAEPDAGTLHLFQSLRRCRL